MAEERVDPGALLVAVLTVGVGPLMEDGAWSVFNTAVSAIVLVVVICYLWPSLTSRWRHLVAFCLVTGFITAIGLAWPIQRLWAADHYKLRSEEWIADRSSGTALVLVLIILVFFILPGLVWARYIADVRRS